MNDCIFCRILTGDVPGSFVFRDDRAAAFMDIQPVNPGHVLIIPIQHFASLAEIDAETASYLMRVGQRVAAAIRESDVRCEGINFFLADGEAAMQEVFHVHLHVFPRFAGDGFGLRFSPAYFARPERAALDHTAASIRTAMLAGTAPPGS